VIFFRSLLTAVFTLTLLSCGVGHNPRFLDYGTVLHVIQQAQIEPSPLDVNKSDFKRMGLRGNVRLFNEKLYGAKFRHGRIVKTKDLRFTLVSDYNRLISFNDKGRRIEAKYYSRGDLEKDYWFLERYEYNEANLLIETTTYRVDAKYVNHHYFQYAGNHLRKDSSFDPGRHDQFEPILYSYDSTIRQMTQLTTISRPSTFST
jgi:hypothetical protein